MKTLVGGVIAAVLGIIGLSVWWKPFLQLLAGAIGFDELKDSWKKDESSFDTEADKEDVDKYKQEIEDLKKEIKTLKEDKEEE